MNELTKREHFAALIFAQLVQRTILEVNAAQQQKQLVTLDAALAKVAVVAVMAADHLLDALADLPADSNSKLPGTDTITEGPKFGKRQ